MKLKLDAIIFDFEGVLGTGNFYKTLNEGLFQKIDTDIFNNSKKLIRAWMRGHRSSDDINKLISKRYGINSKILRFALEKSARLHKINFPLIKFAKKMKDIGINIAMTTDNMDIFGKVTIPHYHLDDCFNPIITSYDHGIIKEDCNGKLFDITVAQLRTVYPRTLVVDDRAIFKKAIEDKGGYFYQYPRGHSDNICSNFIRWFSDKFSIKAS